jgi:hypothetical protein
MIADKTLDLDSIALMMLSRSSSFPLAAVLALNHRCRLSSHRLDETLEEIVEGVLAPTFPLPAWAFHQASPQAKSLTLLCA